MRRIRDTFFHPDERLDSYLFADAVAVELERVSGCRVLYQNRGGEWTARCLDMASVFATGRNIAEVRQLMHTALVKRTLWVTP